MNDEATLLYRASKHDCDACELKPRCCPKMLARKVPSSIHEQARDVARDIVKTCAYVTSRRERKMIEMLFAHLKRILHLDRLRLRGPFGARDEFLLAATAQNLRKLAADPSACFEARDREARARLPPRTIPTIVSQTSSTQSRTSRHSCPVDF